MFQPLQAKEELLYPGEQLNLLYKIELSLVLSFLKRELSLELAWYHTDLLPDSFLLILDSRTGCDKPVLAYMFH